jgi:two-component system, LytTR family, sensor kinase
MKAVNKISSYWWCQIVGWGGNALMNFFFAWTFNREITNSFIIRSIIIVLLGFIITHLMRWVLLQFNVLQKTFDNQIFFFFGITIGFSFLYSLTSLSLFNVFNLFAPEQKVYNFSRLLIGSTLNAFVTLLVWNLIYFIYHYVERVRKQQLDALQMQSVVKELELKTIKSHINPHFIFNSLNGIRALIDENPSRARTAITELSNILRSSMQAEKVETVTFEKELNIVKDYLALEQMRFEERLRVGFDIDEDTLNQPVPPMMLQTLVENAIKHGISKNMSGGEILIVSRFTDDQHEIIIRNTGRLNGNLNAEGFGLSSTHTRLKLMYGDEAKFTIKDVNGTEVEARVVMPVDV